MDETIDGAAEGIEAGEAALRRHVDAIVTLGLGGERGVAPLDAIGEGVRHDHEPHPGPGRIVQGLQGRSSPTPATPHQGDANLVAAPRMRGVGQTEP